MTNRLSRKLGAVLCFFGWHEFGRWRTIKGPYVVPGTGGGEPLEMVAPGNAIRERRCKWCARIERRPLMKVAKGK